MSMQINRFETKTIENNYIDSIKLKNKTTILIKDHKTDNIISLIQLNDNVEKNTELAEKIITTIEEYIEGSEE